MLARIGQSSPLGGVRGGGDTFRLQTVFSVPSTSMVPRDDMSSERNGITSSFRQIFVRMIKLQLNWRRKFCADRRVSTALFPSRLRHCSLTYTVNKKIIRGPHSGFT